MARAAESGHDDVMKKASDSEESGEDETEGLRVLAGQKVVATKGQRSVDADHIAQLLWQQSDRLACRLEAEHRLAMSSKLTSSFSTYFELVLLAVVGLLVVYLVFGGAVGY